MSISGVNQRESEFIDRVLGIVLRDVPKTGPNISEIISNIELEVRSDTQYSDYATPKTVQALKAAVLREIAAEIEALRAASAADNSTPSAPMPLLPGSPIAKMEATLKDWRAYHDEKNAPDADHKIAIEIHREGISIDIETREGQPSESGEPSSVSLMLEIDTGRPKIAFGKNGADPHGVLLVGSDYAAVSPATGTDEWQMLTQSGMDTVRGLPALPSVPEVVSSADASLRRVNAARMKP